jgi:hypothetical protein
MHSSNENRLRVIGFSRDREGVTSVKSKRQRFQNDFLQLTSIKRRTVATFAKLIITLAKTGLRLIVLVWTRPNQAQIRRTGRDFSICSANEHLSRHGFSL